MLIELRLNIIKEAYANTLFTPTDYITLDE